MNLRKMICPLCKAQQFTIYNDDLICGSCKSHIQKTNGFLDFIGSSKRNEFNLSLWAMEFSPLVFIYEKIWRPLITIPFSDYGWEKKKILELMELHNCSGILDIACGPGNFTRLFADNIKNKNAEITGIDLSVPMLKKAIAGSINKKYSHLSFMRVDVLKWIFTPESFERIHCSGALHLFPDVQNVFHSISMTLKPGGTFVGCTYIKKTPHWKKLKDAFEPLLKLHWFEPEELQQLTANAGLNDWEHHIKKQGIVFRVKKKKTHNEF